MAYASGSTVDEGKTRGEIERMLQKVGATAFGSMSDYEHRKAQIAFTWNRLHIRLDVELPDPAANRFHYDGHRRRRTPDRAAEEYRAECRRRWRCLAVVLKAKLVAVAEGVATLEREFLPYMVMADGSTFGERMAPTIEDVKAGRGRLALPTGTGGGNVPNPREVVDQ